MFRKAENFPSRLSWGEQTDDDCGIMATKEEKVKIKVEIAITFQQSA